MKTMYIRYDGWTPSVLGDAVSGQVNTLRCSFAFSSDWDEYKNRKAIFETDEAKKEESLDENGVCLIPRAVLMKRGKLKISAYGTETGENGELLRYNGRPAEIIVDLGGNVDGESTDDPVYPQIGEAVLYTAQSLTDAQKAQARANIGAGTPYTLPEASPDAIGGVKADSAEETDTQPVRIGGDGKLYTAPGEKTQSDYTQNDATKPDYIKNRPFYEDASIDITWDGDTTGKTSVANMYYHVSAETPSPEELVGATVSAYYNGTVNSFVISDGSIVSGENYAILSEVKDWFIVTYADNVTVYGHTYPAKGVYLPKVDSSVTLYVTAIQKTTIKKLDRKFLDLPEASSDALGGIKADAAETTDTQPVRKGTDGKMYTAPGGSGDAVLYTAQSLTDAQQAQARANIGAGTPYTLPQASPDALGGIKADAAETADTQPVRIGGDGKLYTAPGGGGADISLGISGATAGQVAKVKAVDASGAPTAWEAGDAASGGGASEWTLFQEGITDADVSGFEFDGVGDYTEFLFLGSWVKGSGKAGLSVKMNDAYALTVGNYFVHDGQAKNVSVELIFMERKRFSLRGLSQQQNSTQYNIDELGTQSIYNIPQGIETPITKISFYSSNTNVQIPAGATYALYVR